MRENLGLQFTVSTPAEATGTTGLHSTTFVYNTLMKVQKKLETIFGTAPRKKGSDILTAVPG